MASGDRLCGNCNQWLQNCKCWLGKIRRGEPVGDFSPYAFDWVTPQTVTALGQSGMYYTSTTVTTSKPRKRRHCRQVVY